MTIVYHKHYHSIQYSLTCLIQYNMHIVLVFMAKDQSHNDVGILLNYVQESAVKMWVIPVDSFPLRFITWWYMAT